MNRGLIALAVRHLLSDVRKTALLVIGPALGLALAVSVVCLGTLLEARIEQQVLRTYGPSDVWISYPDLSDYLSEEQVQEIRAMREVAAVAEGVVPPNYLAIQAELGARFQAVSDSPVVPPVSAPGVSLGPDEVAITSGLARRLGVQVGDWLSFAELDDERRWRLAAVVGSHVPAGALEIVYFNLEALRSLYGMGPVSSWLYVQLEEGVDKYLFAAEIRERWGDRLNVDTLNALDEIRENLGGLKMIGIALAGAAFLLSAVLMTGMMQILVRRRMGTLAVLRCIGARRGQILRALLLEVGVIGLLAVMLGAALGLGIALASGRFAAGRLGIEPVYVPLPWRILASTGLVGFLLMLVASIVPAWRAASVPPVDALRRARRSLPLPAKGKRLSPVLLFATVSGICWWMGVRMPVGEPARAGLGLGSAFLFVAFVFAGSWLVFRWFLWLAGPALRRWRRQHGLLAVKTLVATESRSRLTTLMIGASVAAAVAAFTVLNIVQMNFKERLAREFLAPISVGSWRSTASTLPLALAREIQQHEAVDVAVAWGTPFGLDWLNHGDFQVDPAWAGQRRRSAFSEAEGDVPFPLRLPIQPVDLEGLVRLGVLGDVEIGRGDGIAVVTQKAAQHMGVAVGDVLRLYDSAQDHGYVSRLVDPINNMLAVTVAAIIPDPLGLWVSDHALLVDWDTVPLKPGYQQIYSVSVRPVPGREAAAFDLLNGLSSRYPEMKWSTETEARVEFQQQLSERLAIFWIGIVALAVVGLLGMANTVGASLHDRRHELAILRAVGLTPRNMQDLVALECQLLTAGATWVGGVAGLGCVYLLAGTFESAVAVAWAPVGTFAGITLLIAWAIGRGFARGLARFPVTQILSSEAGE